MFGVGATALDFEKKKWNESDKKRHNIKKITKNNMNRYLQLEELGNGTYGSVLLGQRVDTGEKVSLRFVYDKSKSNALK